MQIQTKVEIVKHSFYKEDSTDEIDFSKIGVETDNEDDIGDTFLQQESVLFIEGVVETKNFDYATKSLDYKDEDNITTLWKITKDGPIGLNIEYNIEKLNKNEVFTN